MRGPIHEIDEDSEIVSRREVIKQFEQVVYDEVEAIEKEDVISDDEVARIKAKRNY